MNFNEYNITKKYVAIENTEIKLQYAYLYAIVKETKQNTHYYTFLLYLTYQFLRMLNNDN